MNRRPVADRFWEKVRKTEGCWLWTAYLDKDGYGTLHVFEGDRKTPRRAHRISWELHFGPIPEGKDVLHHCDTPGCVRPGCLFLGDQVINDADRDDKGRNVLGTGHPLHKLTDQDIRSIRSDYGPRGRGGLSMPKLAEKYHVNVALIHRIIHRKSWPHVA